VAPILEEKSIGEDQKRMLKGELLIWRTKNPTNNMKIIESNYEFKSSNLYPLYIYLKEKSE
jgi:hypothetical protein